MRVFLTVLLLILTIPIFANWSVTGDLTHYDVVNPGQKLSKSITISNHSEENLTLIIKQADYAFNSEGNIWFVEAGKLTRSNASWISFSSQEINILPNSQIIFSYNVKIPDNDDLNGSYWSLILIQEGKIENLNPSQKDLNLQINQRYAIQSIQQIGNTGHFDIQFLDAEYQKKNNELHLTVKNNGERWTNPGVWVELYDSEGNKTGKFYAKSHKLYPQTSFTYKIPLIPLTQKKYYVITVVDCGENKVFGSQYTIEN
ncbi:MAG TPA: hypothetical protein PKJ08_07795 [Candidatus Cloacimonadota bacterium]|nr:hypothetical protein [Candidatus Cloacimonadota bacterium]HPM00536.1 hypothetical protein [Candidatus Cloacimonadota bacterium]